MVRLPVEISVLIVIRRGWEVFTMGSKFSKFSYFERRVIVDMDSIKKIANDDIGYMNWYKSKLKGDADKVLAYWLLQQSKEGCKNVKIK